jgi:rubrerythrin
MTNIPNDPNAVLEAALANELEAHDILLRAEESVDSTIVKATFEFLAREELKHIEIIKKFAEDIKGLEAWDQESLEGLKMSEAAAHIRGIFQRFATQFEQANQTDDARMEVYKVAMDMERRGYEFYSRAAGIVTEEKAKQLFSFLAGEEQKHFQIIQDTHDYLENPDGLMAMEEHWMQT